jgi:hypothetical protein
MTQKLENQIQEVNLTNKKKRGFNYLMGEILTVGGMFIPLMQYCMKADDYANNLEYFIKTDPNFLYAGLIVSGIGILTLLQDRSNHKNKF